MFLEYKKDKNALRFVYDPKNQHDKEYISKVNSKIEEESDRRETTEICGVVLVPKEVKASVDSIFQKLVTVELEFELGVTYGHIVETVFRNMCNIDRCQKPCLHDYDGRDRIWAHEIYHKLIEEFSNQRSMKRKDFVKNLRDYDSFQFLKKYDIDTLKKPKIMSRKEGMDFVVTSLFRSVGHLNMAEIEDEDFDLLNKSLFKDCKAGHCKNNHKFTQIVWESKGEVEGPPDTNSVNQTRPMPFIKNYKPEKRMIPRAKIRFNECKCSQSQGEYELLDYKDDWEGYPVSKNKDIQPLFEKYFSDILTAPQAKVAAKLLTKKLAKPVEPLSNADRQAKILLENNIQKWLALPSYLPDLEHIIAKDIPDLLDKFFPLRNSRKKRQSQHSQIQSDFVRLIKEKKR